MINLSIMLKNITTKKQPLISITIDQDVLSLIILKKTDKVYQIASCKQLPLEKNITIKAISSIIKKALNGKKAYAAFSINHSKVIYKNINIAKNIQPTELNKFIKFSIEKQTGESIKKIIIDYHQNISATANKQNISIYATEYNNIAEYLKIAKQCKLKIKFIDINSHALTRAINSQITTDKIVMALDITKSQLLVCLIENKELIYTNEKIFSLQNSSSPKEIIEQIANEIQLCLITTNKHPENIFLTGDINNLQAALKKTHETIDQHLFTPTLFEKNNAAINETTALLPCMAIAYGLALRLKNA